MEPRNIINHIERPLDLLNALKGKDVKVTLKGENAKHILGELVAFDIHINLVLEVTDVEGTRAAFVRGESIFFVEEVR